MIWWRDMARTRNIKPEFFTSEELAAIDHASGLPCRLAYAGLWCQADREGRFVWDAGRLKLAILPWDAIDMRKVLDALEQGGFLCSYVVDGKRYGWIPTLKDHQTFHIREGQSKLPPPPFNLAPACTLPAPATNGASTVHSTNQGTALDLGLSDAGTVSARRKSEIGNRKSVTEEKTSRAPRLSKAPGSGSGAAEPNGVPSWVATFGELWREHRGQPNFGLIGRTLKPLIDQHGEYQVGLAWDGYLTERDGKEFCNPSDFAQNYQIHRDRHAVEVNPDGSGFVAVPDHALAPVASR
jgi:hypothetical protein